MNTDQKIDEQTDDLFKARYLYECKRVNRLMIALMAVQWFAGVAFAMFYSPLTWIGQHYEVHVHVWAAVLLGGAISGFATLWTKVYPDAAHSRHVIAISQMLWSALLIHLTGGRIETHFHVFASLAILSIYRDWKILITATAVVAIDHLIRGVFYPLSAFGIVTESPYRWIEHAAWVMFEVAFLAPGCMRLRNEFRELCVRQTELMQAKATVDVKVLERTEELLAANRLLAEKTAEAEKLALVAKHTDNAVAITDHESRIQWVNEGFTRMTGYDFDEVVGRNRSEFQFGEESDMDAIQDMRDSIQQQQGFDGEILCYRKSGEPYWVATEVRPIQHNESKDSRFISVDKDISQRKAMEFSLASAEQRLRSLVNNVPGAFYRCNAANNCMMLFVSNSIREITGHPPEDFVEHGTVTLQDMIHPDDLDTVQAAVQSAIDQRGSYEVEYRIVDGDAGVKWVWERGQCLENGDKNAILDGMIFDITERKIAEAEIASKGKLIEQSLNEIYIFDADSFRFKYVNRAGRVNLAYEQDELLNLTPVDIKPEFDHKTFDEIVQQLKTGEQQQLVFQTKHERKDSSTYDVEVRLQMSRYQGKDVFLAFILDITDRLEAESHNKRLQEELMNASRKAGMAEVATGVLHNVGNILNSVNVSASVIRRQFEESAFDSLKRVTSLIAEHESTFVDFVRDDHRGKKIPTYLCGVTDALSEERTMIDNEFDDLVRNIDHIKDIVSVQQTMAKCSGVQQELSAHDVIHDLVTASKASLANHHVAYENFVDPSTPKFVSDKHRILQILINLVNNAKDSVNEHKPSQPTITVEVAGDEHAVVFRVSDNGLGIAPEKLSEIFQHGYTTKPTGHGFGLHSCANAAAELGGKLTVASDGIGKGATFELCIPTAARATTESKHTLAS